MARKPNYNFERKERDRIKAEKKAKRAAEKKEVREKGGLTPERAIGINGNSTEDSSGE